MCFKRLACLTANFALVAAATALGQATYYVAPGGNDGAAGTNWPGAFLTIGRAVAVAVTGDEVLVSNGTYSITQQILITNGIALRGVNGADVTTIRRQSGTDRILYISNLTAVVSGFTIREGTQPAANNQIGGGILIMPTAEVSG